MNERQIFEGALEYQEPEKRAAFLEKACAGDAALRARVEQLLASHGAQSRFLNVPAMEQMAPNEKLVDHTVDHTPAGAADDDDLDDEASRQPDLSFLAPPTKPGSIGSLGHFEVLQVLGHGGFGIVFRAFDEKLHRHVAIKVMNPQLAVTSPPRKRFIREARAVAALKHDNIVQVYGVEEQAIPYLVMEFVEGQTLQQKLDGTGPLELAELLHLARQMASGLAAAHEKGLIHRDIKPGNILIERGSEQKVKITDFGLARAADDASMTRTGIISGTPLYMSPEQAQGKPLDARSDLFSLGSVLYQMACGRPPFRAPNTIAVLLRVVEDTPRDMREVIPELPEWLVAIVMKLLEKDPAQRFQSAKELADLLGRCHNELQLTGKVSFTPAANSEPAKAPAPLTPEPARDIEASRTAAPSSATTPAGSFWSNPAWLGMAAVMLIAALYLGYLVIRNYRADLPVVQENPLDAPPKFAGGEWIDVLPLIDPQADRWQVPPLTGKNDWRLVQGELVVARDERASKLIFPLDSDWKSLECELEVTRRAGASGLNLNLPASGGDCPVVFDSDGAGMVHLGSRRNGAKLAPGTPMGMGERVGLRVELRRERELDHIAVFMQGKKVGEWSGDRQTLVTRSQENLPHARRLSLWVNEGGNEFVFHRIRVRTLDATLATALRAPPSRIAAAPVATGWQGWPADAPKPAIAPFDAAQAKKHQQEWADYLKVPVEWENSIGMKFRLIPPGEFLMGSSDAESAEALVAAAKDRHWEDCIKSERPQHKVILTHPHYLSVHEVTQKSYETVVEKNPSHFAATGGGKTTVEGLNTASHPVEGVSWNDAVEFCARLSSKEKRNPFHFRTNETVAILDDNGYRLPTEGQWEFACRAGTVTKYWIGNESDVLAQAGWFDGNGGSRTHAVGELRANPFGLHDTHGNVQEWVRDWWEPAYFTQFERAPARNPDGPSFAQTRNVIRGGFWGGPASQCRAAFRFAFEPKLRYPNIGFRVSIPVEAVRTTLSVTGPALPANLPVAASWQGWPADAPKPAIAPFDAAQAKQHQKEWADYLKVPVEWENSIGMKFVLVPPGEFPMGSSEEEIAGALAEAGNDKAWAEFIKSESPRHQVVLTQPFYLAIHETTQSHYQAITQKNPSVFATEGAGKDVVAGLDTAKFPVERVNWHDAAQFAALLGEKDKLKSPRQPGSGYRLPTEAEWEFACRAGTTTKYSFGDNVDGLSRVAWTAENSPRRTHAVGELAANPLGIFDLLGNVWEWVQDSWEPTYYAQFSSKPAIDPKGPVSSDPRKVVRGGGFSYGFAAARSANRLLNVSTDYHGNCGFRLALPWKAVRELVDAKRVAWQGWPADAPKPAIAPFDAAQAKQHQQEWADYLKVPVEWENSIGMKFRLIPPGKFQMGSTPAEIAEAQRATEKHDFWQRLVSSEGPRHEAEIRFPFYLAVNEVAQEDYQKLMETNPSYFAKDGKEKLKVTGIDTSRFPVENTTWHGAVEFCTRLSEREKLKPFSGSLDSLNAPETTGYRLPTEAEWEFACRAGTTTKYWSGDSEAELAKAGWVNKNSGGLPHPVGSLAANPFGLFDMHGNVWEGVQEAWDPAAYEKQVRSPNGPAGEEAADVWRTMRGGCWFRAAVYARSPQRLGLDSNYGTFDVGFRAALSVAAVRAAVAKRRPISWQGWPADAPKPAIAPFTAAQAKQHQKEWAEYLKVPVEFENSIGMKFKLIPPGEFLMGSTEEEVAAINREIEATERPWQKNLDNEAPQHRVILTRPFFLALQEVTQSEYEQLIGANPSYFSKNSPDKKLAKLVADVDTRRHPVEGVSWHEANDFCRALNGREKLDPLTSDQGYFLPTEAQWEFACRAGTTTRFWSGNLEEDLYPVEWAHPRAQSRTQPVGKLSPNPFGLFDLHGNVKEWVHDKWAEGYYRQFAQSAAIDPKGPSGATGSYVQKGGCYGLTPIYGRAALDNDAPASFRYQTIGFRPSLSVEGARQSLASRGGSTKSAWQSWPADAPQPAIAPFTAEQAKQHQKEWADYLKVPVEYENSVGMKFKLIPPGEFLMGSTEGEIEAAEKSVDTSKEYTKSDVERIRSEGPQHRVVLTQPFYIGDAEVTQRAYQAMAGKNPSHFSKNGTGKDQVEKEKLNTDEHPVTNLTWNDAVDFCSLLSEKEELKSKYSRSESGVALIAGGIGYQLPTEAQWEFACRAGTMTKYWCGDSDEQLMGAAWSKPNAAFRSHAVRELKANAFELFDMSGNVLEWMEDGWSATAYSQAPAPALDPRGEWTNDNRRVTRGGSFQGETVYARSAHRGAHDRMQSAHTIGIRLSISIAGVKKSLADREAKATSAGAWQGWPAGAPKPAIAPFTAEQAKQHQKEWADYLKVPVEYENSVGMKFNLIPPGEFTMGSTPEEVAVMEKAYDGWLEKDPSKKEWVTFIREVSQSEGPQHRVAVTRPFYLAIHETTQKQFLLLRQKNPSYFSAQGKGAEVVKEVETEGYPVESVAWSSAMEFCRELTKREPKVTKLAPERMSRLPIGFRLPSEAEWEFACRGGTRTTFHSGQNATELLAVSVTGNSTRPVGSLLPNPFGIYDMHGNVYEWCLDTYQGRGVYTDRAKLPLSVDPLFSESTGPVRHLLRGGCALTTSIFQRSAARAPEGEPGIANEGMGFRVAISLEDVREALPSTKAGP